MLDGDHPDDRLVFATMTGYGYITSWRLDGNVLSIGRDSACPKVPGDGTFRGIGGIVGSGPNDIWLTPDRAYLYHLRERHETGGLSRPTGWFARRGHQREHSVQQPAGLDRILIPPQRLKKTRVVTVVVLMVASREHCACRSRR
jgi:hypothetical protein